MPIARMGNMTRPQDTTGSSTGTKKTDSNLNIGVRIAPAGVGIAWGPARPVDFESVIELYPMPTNTQSVLVGTDGDPNCFASTSRYVEIPKANPMMVFPIENLALLIVKNSVAGEGIVVRIRAR